MDRIESNWSCKLDSVIRSMMSTGGRIKRKRLVRRDGREIPPVLFTGCSRHWSSTCRQLSEDNADTQNSKHWQVGRERERADSPHWLPSKSLKWSSLESADSQTESQTNAKNALRYWANQVWKEDRQCKEVLLLAVVVAVVVNTPDAGQLACLLRLVAQQGKSGHATNNNSNRSGAQTAQLTSSSKLSSYAITTVSTTF